jgi:hypothetical protein
MSEQHLSTELALEPESNVPVRQPMPTPLLLPAVSFAIGVALADRLASRRTGFWVREVRAHAVHSLRHVAIDLAIAAWVVLGAFVAGRVTLWRSADAGRTELSR